MAGLSGKHLSYMVIGSERAATISAWEAEESLPNLANLRALSATLGVSIDWLVHGPGAIGRSRASDADAQDLLRVVQRKRRGGENAEGE